MIWSGFDVFDEPGRLRRPSVPERGYLETVADLVIEVVSPNDRARGVREKIAEWPAAGGRVGSTDVHRWGNSQRRAGSAGVGLPN